MLRHNSELVREVSDIKATKLEIQFTLETNGAVVGDVSASNYNTGSAVKISMARNEVLAIFEDESGWRFKDSTFPNNLQRWTYPFGAAGHSGKCVRKLGAIGQTALSV